LRYLFIGLLFLFLVLVMRAIYRDIRHRKPRGGPRRRKKKDMPHLVVVTADRNIGAKYYWVDDVLIAGPATAT